MSSAIDRCRPDRSAGQRIFVVQLEDYVYLVPFVEDDHSVFLKTIIPSRKATKQHLRRSPTMKIDAEAKELLESVERGEWSPPVAVSANELASLATQRRRSARIVG